VFFIWVVGMTKIVIRHPGRLKERSANRQGGLTRRLCA
jgi:hypothetical protein